MGGKLLYKNVSKKGSAKKKGLKYEYVWARVVALLPPTTTVEKPLINTLHFTEGRKKNKGINIEKSDGCRCKKNKCSHLPSLEKDLLNIKSRP